MATRNINLTDALDRFVADQIASGSYQNASEVVRDALRLLKGREDAHHAKLARLRGDKVTSAAKQAKVTP